jgi:hypothetical protein
MPGAHRDVTLDPRCVEEAHPVTNSETHVVANHAGLLYTHVIEKTEDVLGQARHLVSVRRNVRPAKAAKVGTDDPVALAERANQVPPHPPVLRPPVEQNDWMPASCFGVVQPDAVDVDVVMGYTGYIWEQDVVPPQFGSAIRWYAR